jgi:glycosyltransferase involved in cell wall biosynthesis
MQQDTTTKIKLVQIFLNRSGGTLKSSVKLAESFSEDIELKAFVSNHANSEILKDRHFYTKVNTGTGKIGNIINTLNPFNYYRILREIKAFSPDVIHFPIEHAWDFVFLLALKKFPIVQTIHDPVRHLGEENLIYDFLRHLALQRANRIVVLSKQFKNYFEKFGIRSDCVDVIPHGSFLFDRDISEPPLKNKILFSGRINKYKGLATLLRAFSIVQKTNPNSSLTIAGNGDVEPYRDLLNSSKNVRLINRYITEDELRTLHSECDFVVVPYIEASQSGVIALAAANGRAVISSDVGGLGEQVVDGKTGFLVQKNNPLILAKKIKTLLGDNNMVMEMGRNASRYFNENYGWESISQKNIETYTRAIETHQNLAYKKRSSILVSAIKYLFVEKFNKLKNSYNSSI